MRRIKQRRSRIFRVRIQCSHSRGPCREKIIQAAAELCQAQVELEVIVDVVEEAWS